MTSVSGSNRAITTTKKLVGIWRRQSCRAPSARWSAKAGTSKPKASSSPAPAKFKIQVRSGIDWFELHGKVDFGGATASLPALLAALQRGETWSSSATAPSGLLPEEWLKQIRLARGLGQSARRSPAFHAKPDRLARRAAAAQPEARFDADFRQRARAAATLRRHRSRRAARGFIGRVARLSKRRPGLVAVPAQFGFGGCLADDMGGQNRAGAGAAGSAARVTHERRQMKSEAAPSPHRRLAGRRAEVAGLQLAARGRTVHAQLRVLDHTGRRASKEDRALRRLRPDPHDLRHAAPRRGRLQGHAVRLRHSRRSPGDQERRHRLRQGRAPAARQSPAGAERHAGREPPGRAVEPVRVPQSRHARRGVGLQTDRAPARATPTKNAQAAGPRAAALHPAPHQRAGRPRAAAESSNRRSTARLDPKQRKLYDELRDHYRDAARTASRARASTSRRSKCSKRCCACARPPAIPA